VFKTYDQGWRKWQGTAPHVVWMDEEPDDMRIFTESQTRVLTSKGILLVTFTPLMGETELVMTFTNPKGPGVYLKTATWEDAPHLEEGEKARLRLVYPAYELEARTRGVPMMGEGRVFPVSEDELKVEPFEIPRHFAQIVGVDFGIDHPAAGCRLAWNRDGDILYVVDGYRKANATAEYHGPRVKKLSQGWMPVAWPHDGMNRDKASGKVLKDQYAAEGVTTMLSMSARYENDKGGPQAQEPVILDILERMNTGRFKVFATCTEWFEEFRSYHRKDGKLVAVRDDLLKASFYGVMMKRFARVNIAPPRRPSAGAAVSMRM
jgi:phage terminase large subunit-like protein